MLKEDTPASCLHVLSVRYLNSSLLPHVARDFNQQLGPKLPHQHPLVNEIAESFGWILPKILPLQNPQK